MVKTEQTSLKHIVFDPKLRKEQLEQMHTIYQTRFNSLVDYLSYAQKYNRSPELIYDTIERIDRILSNLEEEKTKYTNH